MMGGCFSLICCWQSDDGPAHANFRGRNMCSNQNTVSEVVGQFDSGSLESNLPVSVSRPQTKV